jgi:hypothetical protein
MMLEIGPSSADITSVSEAIDLLASDKAFKDIPRGHQGGIRRTLARIGITDASLFPELDYQSRYLHKRWTTDQAEPEEE